MRLVASLALLVLSSAAALPAHAGQMRVDVANLQFTPATVTINHGDHVVWVWKSGLHSATSGTSCTADGIFNSLLQTTAAGVSFSWKSGAQSSVPYFCIQHCDLGMTGEINFGSGVAVSDFCITEVQYNLPSGQDLIEITNHGAAAGNLGDYRLSVQAGTAVTVPLTDLVVPAGSQVVFHCNASGANTATDVYLPALPDLPSPGSVALYVPNSTSGQTALTDVTQIIDFVQWGQGGEPNEATAAGASLWTAGQFVPAAAAGHSLEHLQLHDAGRHVVG